MPTDVIMPQMGESIFEGTITKWLRKPGDTVEKDEPLFEISTDKVDAEIPAPVSGILSEIKVQEGATVEINTVVAVMTESGGAEKPASPVSQTDQPAGDTATDVLMPQMGESIFEGTITKWLKKIGDTVEKDEPLFEISTDKVDAEIPAPTAGVLTEIRFEEGATVGINVVVAVLSGTAGQYQASATAPAEVPPDGEPEADSPQSDPSAVPEPANPSRRIRSSPLVRRIVKEHNLDLSQISGTGSEGRVTKEDILRHLSTRNTASAAPAQPPATPQIPGQLVPLSKMRAIIGQRMVESLQTSPHAHTVYKVDMTRIARLRERERAGFEKRNGVRLTYMPFIAAAAIAALRKFPIVNSSLQGGFIRYHRNVHLGIAVALEWGLIVPVIREAENRGFVGVARAIVDLAERARTKKLTADEATGSTFTLTNSGVFGGEFGTPIINQPESAILAIGGLRKEPVVLTDAEGNDTIAIRSMQYFCLGFDHRTVDGGDAGKFMSEFKKVLENWNAEIG